jgi:hypothetical protein
MLVWTLCTWVWLTSLLTSLQMVMDEPSNGPHGAAWGTRRIVTFRWPYELWGLFSLTLVRIWTGTADGASLLVTLESIGSNGVADAVAGSMASLLVTLRGLQPLLPSSRWVFARLILQGCAWPVDRSMSCCRPMIWEERVLR